MYEQHLRTVATLSIIMSMSTDLTQVSQSALSLPQSDRAKIASVLLRSLDPEVDDDPQVVAEEWGKVILARSDALNLGKVELIDSEEVITELRTMISGRTRTSESKAATNE